MTVAEILATLPDDARVTVTVGQGDLRVRDLRDAFAGPDPHRVLTTGEAADCFGYSPDSWRRWAPDIAGAYQDEGDRAFWRLPYAACVQHLERLRAERSVRRRKRGPWAASASTRETRAESVPARALVGGRSSAVERRKADDARSARLWVAR